MFCVRLPSFSMFSKFVLMLEYISVLHSFLWPSNIPYYDTSFYLPIHSLIDIWLFPKYSTSGNYGQCHSQRIMYKYLFSILLGTYLSMRWLDHIIIQGLMWHHFPQWLHHFTFPTQCIRISIILHLHQNFLFSMFPYSCDPSGWKWYWVVGERKMPGFLASGREEFNLARNEADCSEVL